MSNQAYLSVWCRDFSEERMLDCFAAFLATAPLSPARPGFESLVIRAVDASQAPLLEQDMRSVPLGADGISEIVRDYQHTDCAYEALGHWDLAVYDGNTGAWKVEPQPLEIYCHGEDYDEGFWQENGHLEASLGLEHLFTGHAGLLGIRGTRSALAESPEEARFLEAMAWPENLEKYQEKTRENIHKLFEWVRRVEKLAFVERLRLWSEGEENFEARLEEILAVR